MKIERTETSLLALYLTAFECIQFIRGASATTTAG